MTTPRWRCRRRFFGSAGGGLPAWGAAVLVLGVLVLAVTRPLIGRMGSHVVLGTEGVATVPHASLWGLSWSADRALHGWSGLWDAPLFHPTPMAFALSEPLLAQGLLAAPLIGAGSTPWTAGNVVLLTLLFVSGLAAWRLARALGVGRVAAVATAAMVVVLPTHFVEAGVLALVGQVGFFVALRGLVRLGREPSRSAGLELGAGVALGYLLSAQMGLFGALVVASMVPMVLGRRLLHRDTLRALTWAGLPLVALAPVVWGQVEARELHGLTRGRSEVSSLAATGQAWLRAPFPQLVSLPFVEEGVAGRAVFPGTGKVLAAAAALVWGIRRRRWEAWTSALAVGGAVSLFVGLGPKFVGWDVLTVVVPGLEQVRAVYRATAYTQIAIVLLAGLGLHALTIRTRSELPALLVGAFLVVEMVPSPLPTAPAPDPTWARWVARNTPEDAILMTWPLPEGGSVRTLAPVAEAMVLQRIHGRALADGYSSYAPEAYRTLVKATRGLPREEQGRRLAAAGVTHLVVRDAGGPGAVLQRFRGGLAVHALENLSKIDAPPLDTPNGLP